MCISFRNNTREEEEKEEEEEEEEEERSDWSQKKRSDTFSSPLTLRDVAVVEIMHQNSKTMIPHNDLWAFLQNPFAIIFFEILMKKETSSIKKKRENKREKEKKKKCYPSV